MKAWLVFLFAVVIYGISVFGGFVQDDLRVVAGDRDMGKVSALLSVWGRPYYYNDGEKATLYRPVTSFSLYLNALVLGKNPWGFRLINILMYGLLCVLVYKFLFVFLKEKAFWAATIFTVLPIHTEVVNNIVGRAEMLAMIAVLSSILFAYKKNWFASSIILFLGFLCKESAIVGFPAVMYLLVRTKVKLEEKLGAGIIYLMSVVGFVLIYTAILGNRVSINNATIVENPLRFANNSQRIITAIGIIPFGIGKVLMPIKLSYDYSFNQIEILNDWWNIWTVGGIGLILLSLMSLLTKLRNNYMWILGMCFFWGSIAVTGNILFPVGTIFGERLWFWQSLGFLMIVFCLIRITNKYLGLLGLIVIFSFSIRTISRNVDWLSQERLFVHDASYVTNSVLAQSNKAAMYLMERDLDNAKKAMENADKIYPKYPELLNNWGLYYQWTGDFKKAKEKFGECLVERPDSDLCKLNLSDLEKK